MTDEDYDLLVGFLAGEADYRKRYPKKKGGAMNRRERKQLGV